MSGTPEHTFAAVVLDWYGTAVPDRRSGAVRLRRLLESLCGYGVEIIVLGGPGAIAEIDGQLAARPGGPGALHVCADGGTHVYRITTGGPVRTRTAVTGPQGWVVDHLDRHGIGPGLVLAVGPRSAELFAGAAPQPHRGDGPAAVRALLAQQVAGHRDGAVPDLDDDARWLVRARTPPSPRRVCQALTTVSDGHFGTRGSLEEEGPGAGAGVLAAGVYEGHGADQHLLPGPLWTVLGTPDGRDPDGPRLQTLDLRTGVLSRRSEEDGHGLTSLRFASVARAGVVAMRAQGRPAGDPGPPLRLPAGALGHSGSSSDLMWATVDGGTGSVSAAASQRTWPSPPRVERIAAFTSQPSGAPRPGPVRRRLRAAARIGFPALLAEQRAAWASRWADARVDLPDDPAAELALRFATFHLLATVGADGEAAVGARGLSGPGYSGHVFWDADVYVLPVLAAVRPAAARAMLGYRLRRLDAARATAVSEGGRGARFPWESARDGSDVTPRSAVLGDRVTAIRTGDLEVHIVADVAWSAWRYAQWSGDEGFLRGPGRPLLVETARYWSTRARRDPAGVAHIDAVIGPDEYHVGVDDDAFTNVMARWNLRRAAELVRQDGPPGLCAEAADWCRLADALVDGYDGRTRRHEQFAGFDGLEPLLIAEVAQPPVAADILLGSERVAGAQILKQADVVLLHLLVPDELPPGSLERDLDYYGPRTAHGSSLSPAVNAAVLARAGRTEEALRWFRIAAAMDLEDLSGMAGSGLHLATMGGLWQAYVQGFMGIVPSAAGLQFDPRLPEQWRSAAVRVRYRGRRVRASVEGDTAVVEADRPIRLLLPEAGPLDGRRIRLRRDPAGWTPA